jgi:hypothetical protein
MRHFLEHSRNPNRILKKAYNLLNENGVLFLTLPNMASLPALLFRGSWQWVNPPSHLFYFNPKSIKKLLATLDFKIMTIQCTKGPAHSLGLSFLAWIADLVGIRKKGNNIRNWRKKQVTLKNYMFKLINLFSFPLDQLLEINHLGPEMIIVAQK